MLGERGGESGLSGRFYKDPNTVWICWEGRPKDEGFGDKRMKKVAIKQKSRI